VSSPQARQKARARALEYLFGLEFTQDEWRGGFAAYWETFDSKEAVRIYAELLVQGVFELRAQLDAGIDGALTNWTPERVGRIERNILRLALYEMTSVADVPPKVAINEAIELAKGYGSDDSPAFVNAVLDRLKDAKLRESTA